MAKNNKLIYDGGRDPWDRRPKSDIWDTLSDLIKYIPKIKKD